MLEVMKDEFYRKIGKLDCHPRPRGNYPYTSDFVTSYGVVVGVAEDYHPEGHKGIVATRYFIP
jgi:hypothetical protein